MLRKSFRLTICVILLILTACQSQPALTPAPSSRPPLSTVQPSDMPKLPTATAIPFTPTATIVPATATPLPATPTTVLPTATSVPTKIINLTKDQIETLDLGAVDSDFQALAYSFTDGKFGYFLVKPNQPELGVKGYDSGKVARVDLQAFSTRKVTVIDLAKSDPMLKDFSGGFVVGQYAYFVPTANGLVARVDLQNFTSSGVTTLNLAAVDPSLIAFEGGFSDGHFAYFNPLIDASGAASGKVVRVDLQNFNSSGVKVFDLTKVNEGLAGFGSGFTDGHYAYFMSLSKTYGGDVRVDLQDFTPNGVKLLDLAKIDPREVGTVICFTDGHYVYSMPWEYIMVTREDLNNYTPNGVTILDLGRSTSGVTGAWGGMIDGSFGYFNLQDLNYGPTSKVARVNLQNFTADGVTILNFETADSRLSYLIDGFTNGQYLYFESAESGLIVRIKPDAIPTA
jgi:hypothetical protein